MSLCLLCFFYFQFHAIWFLVYSMTDYRNLQFWLLGYEFPATLLVFTTEVVYVVTTAKKGKQTFRPSFPMNSSHWHVSYNAAKHLEPLKGGKIPLEILVTSKEPEQKKKAFDKCLEAIKNAGVWVANGSIPEIVRKTNPRNRKKSAYFPKTRLLDLSQMTGDVHLRRYLEN